MAAMAMALAASRHASSTHPQISESESLGAERPLEETIQMMFHRTFLAAVVAMLVSSASSADTGPPIEIVAAFNLTGDEAVLDLPCYRGAEVAVDKINAAGGVSGAPLKLIGVDTKSDLAETAELVGDALRKHPDVVAGIGFTYSSYVLAAGPAFQAADIPFVTPGATDPSLPNRIGNDIFLACYGDDAQAKVMAMYAYQQLKLRRVALWADSGPDYTKTVAKYFERAFEALGGTIVRTDYAGDEPDLASRISKFMRANPPLDGIYGATMPVAGEPLIAQCRAAGIDVPLLSGDGWDDPNIIELSKKHNLDNIYFTTHRFLGVQSPSMKSFVTAYEAKFGQAPSNAFAPLGYDTVNLIVAAIHRAGSSDAGAIRNALANTVDFSGIVGPISYADGSRVPTKPVEVIRVEDGTEAPVWQATPAK